MAIYLVLITLLIVMTFIPKPDKRLPEHLFFEKDRHLPKYLSWGTNKRLLECLYWGMAVVLVIIAGFRYDTGTDYSTYYHYYDNIRKGGEPWSWMSFEWGFILLNKAIGLFYFAPEVYMFIVSTITVFLILYTCNSMSLDRMMSMLLFVTLYFYFSSFNILRQYLAIAIVFFSITFIKKGKLIPYILCIVLASLFHKTALIMLPLYFVSYRRFSLPIQGIFLGFCLFIALLGRPIITLIVSFFPKYSVYADFEAGSAWFNLGVLCVVYALALYSQRKRKFTNRDHLYLNVCVIALGLMLLTYCNVLFARMAMYYYVFTILTLPHFIGRLKKKYRFPAKVAAAIMACMVCVYYLLHNNDGVVPYVFAFFK